MTSALDMPEIMSYIYNKSWKLQFSASSSIIIIEDFYLQTFLHSLKCNGKTVKVKVGFSLSNDAWEELEESEEWNKVLKFLQEKKGIEK